MNRRGWSISRVKVWAHRNLGKKGGLTVRVAKMVRVAEVCVC